MLNNASEEIRKCLEQAEECARKAQAQTNSSLRELRKQWLELARSMQLLLDENIESPKFKNVDGYKQSGA